MTKDMDNPSLFVIPEVIPLVVIEGGREDI